MILPTFRRSHVSKLMEALRQPHFRLAMLFGPRQSGKTVIVNQALSQLDVAHRYLAFDDPTAIDGPAFAAGAHIDIDVVNRPRAANTQWLVDAWNQARGEADRRGEFVLALDEIQLIHNWSSTVKGLWDADRRAGTRLRVVLLGSAPMHIQKGLQESLVGRFGLIRVQHWSYREMNEAFGLGLDQYLYFGGFPGAFAGLADRPGGVDFESHWAQYVLEAVLNPTVDRDVLAMTNIRKPALMRNLTGLCAEYSGQILSYNKMLGQLLDAGNTTTLANYLQLLESVGLFAGLQGFSGSTFRRRSTSPKLVALNSALMTAGSGYSFEQARGDRTFWGRIVESAVGAHLINTASLRTKIFYWRYRNSEVDFVLRRGPELVGIEVGVPGGRKNTRHLESFAARFAPAKTLLVGADGISLEEFLWEPVDFWFEGR